jgi:hypothetical protein
VLHKHYIELDNYQIPDIITSLLEYTMFRDLDDELLIELLETLADLSLCAETFEIAEAALILQTKLLIHYSPDNPVYSSV